MNIGEEMQNVKDRLQNEMNKKEKNKIVQKRYFQKIITNRDKREEETERKVC